MRRNEEERKSEAAGGMREMGERGRRRGRGRGKGRFVQERKWGAVVFKGKKNERDGGRRVRCAFCSDDVINPSSFAWNFLICLAIHCDAFTDALSNADEGSGEGESGERERGERESVKLWVGVLDVMRLSAAVSSPSLSFGRSLEFIERHAQRCVERGRTRGWVGEWVWDVVWYIVMPVMHSLRTERFVYT